MTLAAKLSRRRGDWYWAERRWAFHGALTGWDEVIRQDKDTGAVSVVLVFPGLSDYAIAAAMKVVSKLQRDAGWSS